MQTASNITPFNMHSNLHNPANHAAAAASETEFVFRCPFCKSRVNLLPSNCVICGQTVSEKTAIKVAAPARTLLLAQPTAGVRRAKPYPSAPLPNAINISQAPSPFKSSANALRFSKYALALISVCMLMVMVGGFLIGVGLAERRNSSTAKFSTAVQIVATAPAVAPGIGGPNTSGQP
jgi:hypothetical protein